MQNGFIESFNGRFQDEFLNEVLFSNLSDARGQIAAWKEDYNQHRPNSALGNIPPEEFAMKMRLEKPAAQAQNLAHGLSAKPEEKWGSGHRASAAKPATEIKARPFMPSPCEIRTSGAPTPNSAGKVAQGFALKSVLQIESEG